MLRGDKIAVIGDLHGRYTSLDNDHLQAAGFDLTLFVGDLGSGTLNNGLQMIRTISRLRVPGLVLPGNNDAPHLAELNAELAFQSGKSELFRLMGPTGRRGVEPCGFSLHELQTEHGGVSLIAARPCAMGGSECSFSDQLLRNHNIGSLEASLVKLKELVDSASHENVMFLAHNGPLGLGGDPHDLWGRDFTLRHRPDAPADWGDNDLRVAIDYARETGRRVIGVVAGHMHRNERHPRPLFVRQGPTAYINCAHVPRVRSNGARQEHHYVELRLDLRAERAIEVTERWVSLGSRPSVPPPRGAGG